ncbi:MAG: translocation/assembly module TamB [Prevotellaceae bacterium]|nr:translocation/assembly module TamB [Prevotellaceae bacterium]
MVLSLPLVSFFVLQIPAVQTMAVHWVTAKIQKQLPHATISVGAVHFSFFNKLVVTKIFIGDTQSDTLLYAGHTTITLSGYDLLKKDITIGSANLYNGVLNVVTTPTGTNIKEAFAGLNRSDSTATGDLKLTPADMSVSSLSLSNFRFTYRNLRNPGNPRPPDVINFKDLALSEIFIDIHNINLHNDTIFFRIKDLSLLDKSGYRIKSLTSGKAYVCKQEIMMHDVKIDDTHSLVRMNSYAMTFNHFRDFNQYVEKVKMSAEFNNTIFSFRTINHLAPNFYMDDFTLSLNGYVSGTVEDLRSARLDIGMPDRTTHIAASFKMAGLPDINETRINIDVEDIYTHAGDLAYILKSFIKDKYKANTDKMIQSLGDIHYSGNFTGLYDDFVVCGNVETSLGDAQLDMLFHPTENKSYTVEGELRAENFHFGKLLHQKLLGPVSANATATLVFNPASGEDFRFTLKKGDAPAFTFNRYRYTNITLNDVVLSNRDFKGRVKCSDPNLSMDFDGYVAFADDDDSTFVFRHNYTTNIYYANLFRLNFNLRDTISELKANITANYQYTGNFDAGTGRVEITNLFYHDPVGVHQLGTLSLLSSFRDGTYSSQLRANFADADFRGNRPFLHFLKDVSYAGYDKYLPYLSDTVTPHICQKPDYEFKLHFKKSNSIAYLLHPELFIAENTQLHVQLTPDQQLTATFNSPMLALGNDWARKVSVNAQNSGNKMDMALHIGSSEFFGLPVNNISGQIQYADNNISTTLTYDNNSKRSNKGSLHFNTLLSRPEQRKKPLIGLHILPSEIILNDTAWRIKSSPITIDNEILQFNQFQISNQHQQVVVNGTVSHQQSDTLSIHFNNYDLSNFNAFTAQKGYNLKGSISGEALFTGLYDTLMLFAHFDGRKLIINEHPLGDLAWQSNWDNGKKLFRVTAEISENNKKNAILNGIYIPKTDFLEADLTLNHFKAVHVEPLLQKVLTNLGGSLSGNLQVRGSRKKPVLYGTNVVLDSLRLTVDYLKTNYLLTVPVEITPTAISIHNALVRDGMGGKGILNGTLHHQHFKNIKYDLSVQPENMLCLNTTLKDNDAFYGKAHATGFIQIKGDDEQIKFDITATTDANTIVYIPLQNNYQAKESGMLKFVEPEKTEDSEWRPRNTSIVKQGQKMTFNINLAATPNAEAQIIFDQKAGDIIRSRGSGNITFNINPEIDKFDLYGDYSIEQGDYFFTLQNIISKKFIMEQGSRIAFNGDISKTMLDITGVYKTKASLGTLTEDTSSVSRVRRNVDCKIHVSGNLFTPTLSYNVEMQNLDPSIRAQVQSALNTEEKMTRQFLSLLAFNSFMPDQQSGISSVNISASTSELLSNQLSNMFTQLNIPLDVGFMYNFSEQGHNAFDVAVSTQLFDNRVAINGTLGNGKKNTTENSFTGDIDLELKIDPQGRFRAKAFTHSADQFTDQFDNSQRSGVGFVYQEDFNTFKELFNRWFGKKKKRKTSDAAENKQENKAQNDNKEN